ncbi:MAG: alpha/beta hydrolase [Candidatus Aenigmarchaeota archaeon]|nr:alpha/beta hydrolase [Candidatus Aenigmarchaeota archaeon]
MVTPTCELVRIQTQDNLELQGLLYKPKIKTDKILIHIHALIGNFYENLFIDYIAKEVVSKGFAFLTYNNRGAGILGEFIKKEKTKRTHIQSGGSVEKFEDCIMDVGAGIDFAAKKGYDSVVLEGHSLGCQKIAYYRSETKDKRVKKMVFLAPVNDIAYVKRVLGEKYNEFLNIAKKLKNEGKGNELIPKEMAFYPMMTVDKYLDFVDPTTEHGKVLDYSGSLKCLKKINCPSLAIFGSDDDYEDQPEKTLSFLKNKFSWDTELVCNADHWFFGKEIKLSKLISSGITKL